VSSQHVTRRSHRPGIALGAGLLVALLVTTLAVTVQVQSTPSAPASPVDAKQALTGSLQELMRGVFFPTANTIFNVQTHDPAKKQVVTQSGKESLNWVQWGASMYSGWEDVDYAAATLAEITPLLLTPGRLCENGKPVPVDRADWIKFTADLLQAARKSYQASRSRNQEAVSESTNDLNDACFACHRTYRDRRAPGSQRGETNPASMALRCTAS
jgi:hypothetical protein